MQNCVQELIIHEVRDVFKDLSNVLVQNSS